MQPPTFCFVFNTEIMVQHTVLSCYFYQVKAGANTQVRLTWQDIRYAVCGATAGTASAFWCTGWTKAKWVGGRFCGAEKMSSQFGPRRMALDICPNSHIDWHNTKPTMELILGVGVCRVLYCGDCTGHTGNQRYPAVQSFGEHLTPSGEQKPSQNDNTHTHTHTGLMPTQTNPQPEIFPLSHKGCGRIRP